MRWSACTRRCVNVHGWKPQALHGCQFCLGKMLTMFSALPVSMTSRCARLLLSVLQCLLRTAWFCCNVACKSTMSRVLHAVSSPCTKCAGYENFSENSNQTPM